MSSAPYEISSEIYAETNFHPVECDNGHVISKFKFTYPDNENDNNGTIFDKDGDLVLSRKRKGIIEIEHQSSTILKLVGLQVWRGALLLADFLFYKRNEFMNKVIIELGAGVGLTSIVAGIYSNQVLCTDIDLGGILDIIRANINRNSFLLKNNIEVLELDFKKSFSDKLNKALNDVEIVLAADVIYDDDLTDCFIQVLEKLLNKSQTKYKTVYVALEKRYVFTITELDTSAPCFDYFLNKIRNKPWTIESIPIDFPQYFEYERCKELVLLEIRNNF